MKKLNKILLLSFILLSQTVYAEECEVSTTARKLNIDKTMINFDALDKKMGEYRAILKNGNLLLASFAQCSLSAEVHFYSRTAISEDQRSNTIRWLLASILSPQYYQGIEKQIKTSTQYLDSKIYTVSNEFEAYGFEFKPSVSPLFKTVLHYTWLPPEH